MEGDDLFDEFGNLIGVDPFDSDEEESVLDEQEQYQTNTFEGAATTMRLKQTTYLVRK